MALALAGLLSLWLVLVPEADGWAFLLLAVAGASDWVDGYLARRLDQRSELGVILDPLADRLYIAATLLGLALRELNGQRDLRIEFATAHVLSMKRAFLIPQESDGLVKVSDGQKVYVLDAERVVWMEIG